MLSCIYKYNLKNKVKQKNKEIWLYTFKSNKTHQTYIVEIIFYDEYVCTLSFYLKNHRLSPNKYNKNTGFFEANRIIATCLYIYKEIIETGKYPFLSIFVEGVRGENEILREKTTKRFRVYEKVFYRVFSTNYSIYIIKKLNVIIAAPRILTKEKTIEVIKEIKHIVETS